ncbi:MAG: hypothetical protein PUK67_07285 [Prevotellaceae bacterium]|nr:hypothetical protein [Prevotellaceae bacterium]MDY3364492.1 hypothetical protein [Prevotella sp.]
MFILSLTELGSIALLVRSLISRLFFLLSLGSRDCSSLLLLRENGISLKAKQRKAAYRLPSICQHSKSTAQRA